jgi:hypothetical protein
MAKGTNRSWEWLKTISTCLFVLREAMRTVQKTFDIPIYGIKHTTPSIMAEVRSLASALATEQVQRYVPNRVTNEEAIPVRDLLEQGAKYADSRDAFAKFRKREDQVYNRGAVDQVQVREISEGFIDEEFETDVHEFYAPDAEDLGLDDDEPAYGDVDTVFNRAESMADALLSNVDNE